MAFRRRRTGLSTGDIASHLANVVDMMDPIRRLGVLLFDIQVQMTT